MKTLSAKDRRENLFSIFIEKLKAFVEKRRVAKNRQDNDDTADAFEKFCDGIVRLSRGISDFVITSGKALLEISSKRQKFKSDFTVATEEANVTNKVFNALNNKKVVQDFKAALIQEKTDDHIGPLTSQFKAYTKLRKAGIDYRPLEGGYIYSRAMLESEFGKAAINTGNNTIRVFKDVTNPTTQVIRFVIDRQATNIPAYIHT